MKSTVIGAVLTLGSITIMPAAAQAAQRAVVSAPRVEVRSGPGTQYPVIEVLSKGAQLATSNGTLQGYYKVRTPSGAVGWIQASAVAPQGGLRSTAPRASRPMPRRAPPARARSNPKGSGFSVRLLAGADFFSFNEVNQIFQTNAMSNGIYFGGEIGYSFNPTWRAFLRIENIQKSVTGTDSNVPPNTYVLSASSVPVSLGASYTFARSNQFNFDLGAMLSFAPSSYSSAATTMASPNVTSYSATVFGGMIKAEANWQISRLFSIFGEAGYRLLSSGSLATPNTSGNGSQIYTIPISLDFSGPVLGLGVGFSF